MKKRSISLILWFFTFSSVAITQTSDKFGVLYESNDSEIKLKWLPGNPSLLEAGIEHGYNLYRRDYIVDGIQLDYVLGANTEIKLLSNQKPLSQDQWSSMVGNDVAQFASNLLYSEEANPSYENDNLETALESQKLIDNKHMYVAIASDRDFNVAKGLALAYCDTAVKNGDTYLYRLEINHPDYIAKSISFLATTNSIDDLTPIHSPYAEPGEVEALLYWKKDRHAKQYSSYNIERREPGSALWETRNDIPYIFSGDPSGDTKNIVYRDTLEQQDVTYTYRIVGLTPFGTYGPPSEEVTVISKPDKINIDILAHEGEGTPDYNRIGWTSVVDSVAHLVGHFDIYRSIYALDDFVKVNDQPLPPGSKHFDDYEPLPSAYYVVAMTDINGYYHQSGVVLVQPIDSIPPLAPVGVEGSADTDGTITIEWTQNTEQDIDGYRILRSNRRNTKFLDTYGELIPTPTFSENLSLNVIADSVFYKVIAVDKRGNRSECSTIVAVARPDAIPPADPLLHSLSALDNGIYIDLELSESTDVEKHVIERKSIHVGNWTNVMEIMSSDTSDLAEQSLENLTYEHIDSINLEQVVYQYRILAYDHWGNVSSSDIKEITPLMPTSRGEILNFIVEYTCADTIDLFIQAQQLSLQGGIDSLSANVEIAEVLASQLDAGAINDAEYLDLADQNKNAISTFFSYKISQLEEELSIQVCGNTMSWVYPAQDNFSAYKIYRSHNQGDQIIYKTVLLEEIPSDMTNWEYLDDEVVQNDTYTYVILGEYQDSSTTELSEEVQLISQLEE